MDTPVGEATPSAPASRPVRGTTTTRRGVIRKGVAAATVLATAGGVFGLRATGAASAPSRALDEKIFNFALLLEHLQAAFYSEALDAGSLRGELREFAEVVSEHERAHVEFLRRALGRQARKAPTFEFGSAVRSERRFLETAILLENTGVAAYNGQAANLTKKSLSAAATIVSVEGRHAAWISALGGRDPAPRAADPGVTAEEAAATLKATGFIKTS